MAIFNENLRNCGYCRLLLRVDELQGYEDELFLDSVRQCRTRHILKPWKSAVLSPSSSPRRFPRRQARALAELRRHFTTVHLGSGWGRDIAGEAGTPQERAQELMELARMPSRPLLIASTGGYSCNELLPFLDYDELARLRANICGFSDVSTILLAILARSDLISFHGPTVLPTYGEAGGIDPTLRQISIMYFSDVEARLSYGLLLLVPAVSRGGDKTIACAAPGYLLIGGLPSEAARRLASRLPQI